MNISIDIEKLKNYFHNHTLKECAQKFKCSTATIKRRLKSAGVDTSIHNHSSLAYDRFKQSNKDTSFLTKDFLIEQYIVMNKDTKTIAEELDLHYQTIRYRLQKFGIKKDPKNVSLSMSLRHLSKTGYWHPGQRPDVIKKINSCRSRYKYKSSKTGNESLFKSLHELAYAILLDEDDDVESWDYELIKIPYTDRLSGKTRVYYVDFSVQRKTNDEWIEIKPADDMIPKDKYLYANERAKQANIVFRGTFKHERELAFTKFKDGHKYDNVEFINTPKLKPHRTYTLWFKDKSEIGGIQHDHYIYPEQVGRYWKCKFVSKSKNKVNAI